MLRCRRWRSLPISPPSPRKSKKSFSRSLHFLLQMNAFFFFISKLFCYWLTFFCWFWVEFVSLFLKKYFHNVWLIDFFLLIWRLNCSSFFMFYDIFYSEWNFVSFLIISSCVIVFFFVDLEVELVLFLPCFVIFPPIRRWICDFF